MIRDENPDTDSAYERDRQRAIDDEAEARRRDPAVRSWDQLASDIEAAARRLAPRSYLDRVRAYEDEGLTTSDAQGVVDAEDMKAGRL